MCVRIRSIRFSCLLPVAVTLVHVPTFSSCLMCYAGCASSPVPSVYPLLDSELEAKAPLPLVVAMFFRQCYITPILCANAGALSRCGSE